MGLPIMRLPLRRRFGRFSGATLLTSPLGYMDLIENRQQKEFSLLDVYHLASNASDMIMREVKRENRARKAVDLFLRNVFDLTQASVGTERAKQLD